MNPAENLLKIPAPGLLHGSYPEKRLIKKSVTDRLFHGWHIPSILSSYWRTRCYADFLQQVAAFETSMASMSDDAIIDRIRKTRILLSLPVRTDPLIAETFALISLVSQRRLKIKPLGTQLMAARIMLDGQVAEMTVHEEKRLALAICAATTALAGVPVHVITTNDNEVMPDVAAIQTLYHGLGLSTGRVIPSLDMASRQREYACNITYVAVKELILDYLRDSVMGGRARSELHARTTQLSGGKSSTLLRGLCVALINDADSILLDAAQVPLELSHGAIEASLATGYQQAMKLATAMHPREDFVLDRRHMLAELTDSGRYKLELDAELLDAPWHSKLHLEKTVCQALAAHHLYQRDRHYLIRNERIHIMDVISRRILPERVWSRGLHKIIEIKEGCNPGKELNRDNQMTCQRFLSCYFRLAGISMAHGKSRAKLLSAYGLRTVNVAVMNP